jgi:hypothetical protein
MVSVPSVSKAARRDAPSSRSGQSSRSVLDGRGRVPMAPSPFVMDDNQGCVYV